MGASRKLQGEIDRVLKKVNEGVEVFDIIWNKVYDTENANQKEKFEAELKKEIKKLQRYRDQIKAWIQSNEIKDKKALMEARKLIEREMERFKVCEKETKTKAFSKEGLGQQPKTDPKEKAKSETRDWLNNLVTDLESQIDNFEAEAEGLTVKKGKTRPARLTHLETSISRHKAHIVKLEVVLRLLDNDGLSPDQVNDIKDFLEDYVERNQENFDEFDNVDELYSSLPLDQELEELAALGPTLVKDCSDVDDLHGTCVWAARFKFSSFAVVDTQVTKPAHMKGDSDTFDNMRKKFHYITDDIMVVTAGIVPFSKKCIGILRVLKDKFELTDQNKKERSGKQRKGLDLKKLMALFLNGSNLKTFMHNVKARKGRYVAKGEEDDSTSLILISRCEEMEGSVCKIKLVIGDESISVHWGWAMGAGSGYSTAEKALADLTQSSDETQIIEVVKRGFRNASKEDKGASKEDKGTGGSVLILKGSKDVPWDLVEACDILVLELGQCFICWGIQLNEFGKFVELWQSSLRVYRAVAMCLSF